MSSGVALLPLWFLHDCLSGPDLRHSPAVLVDRVLLFKPGFHRPSLAPSLCLTHAHICSPNICTLSRVCSRVHFDVERLISRPDGKNVRNSPLLEKRFIHVCKCFLPSVFFSLYVSVCLHLCAHVCVSVRVCVCVSRGVRSRQGLSRAKESKSVSSPWADNPSDPHSKTY